MRRLTENRTRMAALLVLTFAALGIVAVLTVRAPAGPVPSAPARVAPAYSIPVPPPAPSPEPTLEIKRILDVPGIVFGEYVWDDKNVPPGRVVMTVDLKAQTMSVFRGGYEIGAAAILYGATDKPTPLGRFPVLEKDADHVSSLYDAPMPYMLRLTGDGVAIHGSKVEWGLATHGCIGVPVEFARLLFGAVKKGDLVIVTSGELLKLGDRVA
ncbi:L,D-transpeptidase family protein [uncultured Sphingomonas sp.]|uniref:L,D-transpeptidase family protein n=1 Tax=uncultured Sphingomonas sp. TaxID=158754 RepID=UPI0035CB5A11